jgi:7,8-dihydropterin-6-yl-methyl-4-(beta-D-ribofuranosyl)aminobenzene 5'-phosphate synthase
MKHNAGFISFLLILVAACAPLDQVPGQAKHFLPGKSASTRAAGESESKDTSGQPLVTAAPTAMSERERKNDQMTTEGENGSLKITILYDNESHDTRLQTAWGFSALLDNGTTKVLFDTGADAPTLMSNIDTLGVDPASIEYIFLSHAHNDHVGGLDGFLQRAGKPTIYLLPSFTKRFKDQLSQKLEIVEVTPGASPLAGISSTGEMSGDIPEQALLIHTAQGLVVITGCAHPGIVEIIELARDLTGEQIHLVVGGFHLKDMRRSEIEAIIGDFRRLGVERVAPTHCTGAEAIAMFEEAYGADFIPAGVGLVIQIEG